MLNLRVGMIGDDWVSTCRNVVVAGVRCAGRGRKIGCECVKDDMKVLGLHPEWAVFRICGGVSFQKERLTLAERGKMDALKINVDDDDDAVCHTPSNPG